MFIAANAERVCGPLRTAPEPAFGAVRVAVDTLVDVATERRRPSTPNVGGVAPQSP
jgi:hypothetical protein